MAIALLSAGGEDGISAIFESLEQMQSIQLAGTHQFNDAYGWRVLDAHGPSQVGSGISAVVAAKGHNFGLIGRFQI